MQDHSTQQSQVELTLSSSRWLTLASLCGLGMLIGFGISFPGIVDLILTEYFQLDIRIVDWFTLCNAAAQVIFMVPIGIYAIANPLKIKIWLLLGPLFLGLAFASISVAVFAKELFWMTFIGMAFVGIADAIFRASVPLIATAWFGDRSQGKVCGVSYAFLGSGSSVAAVATAIFLSVKTHQMTLRNSVTAITVIDASCCVISIVMLLIIRKCVPKSPPSPPSRTAAHRWIRYSNETNQLTVGNAAKRFFLEAKMLLADTSAAIMVVSYGIVLATLLINNMMLPPIIEDEQFETKLYASQQKSYLLICYAICSTIGSVLSGVVVDRIGSYRAFVFIIGLASVLSSVAMLIGYCLKLKVVLYLSVGMNGLFFLSLLPILVELLKQHVYPDINEVTQSVFFVILWNIFTIVLSEIFRYAIMKFGSISFYVANIFVCCLTLVLLSQMNPRQNHLRHDF